MNGWFKSMHEDGATYCALLDTPMGEVGVDYAPWLNKAKPWTVMWWPLNDSDSIRIGHAKTDQGGRRMAEAYMRRMANTFADWANPSYEPTPAGRAMLEGEG